jgi:plasmid stabilization system protein ParE
MNYDVTLHPDAEKELKAAHTWLAERSPAAAEQWRQGLLEKAATLARLPERCPLAPESEKLGEPVRQLLYGRRAASRYRLLFIVEGTRVVVLHIRHGAQRRVAEEGSDE